MSSCGTKHHIPRTYTHKHTHSYALLRLGDEKGGLSAKKEHIYPKNCDGERGELLEQLNSTLYCRVAMSMIDKKAKFGQKLFQKGQILKNKKGQMAKSF